MSDEKISKEFEDKLKDFYNHCKQVIISEDFIEVVADLLDKNELRYYASHIIEGGYLIAFLKDLKVGLEEQDIKDIEGKKFYSTFIESGVDLTSLPFGFTYIPLTVKEESVEVIY